MAKGKASKNNPNERGAKNAKVKPCEFCGETENTHPVLVAFRNGRRVKNRMAWCCKNDNCPRFTR